MRTPGDWQISALDGRICGPSRMLVCSSSGGEVPQLQAVCIVTLRTGETQDNARLIAAAPELLEKMKELRDALLRFHRFQLDAGADVVQQFGHELSQLGKATDVLIAKAEGREP